MINNKKYDKVLFILVAIMVLMIVSTLGEKNGESKKYKPIKKSKVMDRIPRLSAWDGVAYSVKDYVKNNFNDPNVEYVNVRVLTELSNGMFAQMITVRATNGFGAKILKDIVFLIQGKGNNASVVSTSSLNEFKSGLLENNISIVHTYDADGKKIK